MIGIRSSTKINFVGYDWYGNTKILSYFLMAGVSSQSKDPAGGANLLFEELELGVPRGKNAASPKHG